MKPCPMPPAYCTACGRGLTGPFVSCPDGRVYHEACENNEMSDQPTRTLEGCGEVWASNYELVLRQDDTIVTTREIIARIVELQSVALGAAELDDCTCSPYSDTPRCLRCEARQALGRKP